MNIIHVLWNFTTGGTQMFLIDLANEQIKTDNVCILAIDGGYDKNLISLLDNRIKFISLGRKSGSKNPIVLLRLNYEIWIRKPDIIHVHMHGISKYIFVKTPIVATIHNAFEKNTDGEYSKYKKIFAISEGVRKHTLVDNGFDSLVIYNGIHSYDISSEPKCKLNIDGNVHFLSIGRLAHVKGQHIVVDAFNVLVNKLGIKNIHIDFIGDGDLRPELEAKIKEYKLENNISLLGLEPKSFFYPHICEYDCFILPSLSEGFGITVAEAMAAKIPVITSDQDGPLEVLGKGKLGISFKTGSVDDLVDKISRYLSKQIVVDLDVAQRYVRLHFDIGQSAKKYLEEYKTVISH